MIGITGKRYGWMNLARAALLHLPLLRFAVHPDDEDEKRDVGAVLFAGRLDGDAGRRARSRAEPRRPADRARRFVEVGGL